MKGIQISQIISTVRIYFHTIRNYYILKQNTPLLSNQLKGDVDFNWLMLIVQNPR